MYIIRRMKVSDINTVIDIQNRNLYENATTLVYLRELYESDLHYVCTYKNDIVGFISCTIHDDEITCNTLCVDLPYRKRNVGSNLLSCIKNEKKKIRLYVRADNKGAREFYTKEGFRVILDNIPCYADGKLGMLMEYNQTNMKYKQTDMKYKQTNMKYKQTDMKYLMIFFLN